MSVGSWLKREKRKTHYQRLQESVRSEQLFNDLADMLMKGVPELGWEGDPWLKVVYNKLFDRLEIVDTHPQYDGKYETLFTTQPGEAIMADPYSMIRRVKMCDHRHRTVDEFLTFLDEQQEAFEKAQDKTEREGFAEKADQLAFAIQRDVGHMYGGSTRRYL